MAFQGADQIDPSLLAAILGGGGRRSSGLGLGSLLEPGPTPQAAWAGTIQQSPFYQGVPSQSGAFGQIAQAILPVVMANAAAGQASEAEKNRRIFLDTQLQVAAAEVEQTKRKYAQEAYNLLLLNDPEARRQLVEGMAPGEEQTITAGGRKATLKKETPFPTLAQQGQVAEAAGLREWRITHNSKGQPVLTATRVKPGLGEQIGGALSKSVTDIGKLVLAKMGDPQLAAQMEMRKSMFDAGTYIDRNDGQPKIVPDKALVKTMQDKLAQLPAFEKNLLSLKEAAIRSPLAAAGASSIIGQIWNGTVDQLGGISLGPLGPEIDRQAALLKSQLAKEPGISPEMRQKLIRDLSISGDNYNADYSRIVALKQIVAYQDAKMKDDTGRLSDQDIQSSLTGLEGGNSLLGKMFLGSQSLQTGIDTILGSVDGHRQTAEKVLADYQAAIDFRIGQDIGVPAALGVEVMPPEATKVLGQGPNRTPLQSFEEAFPTWGAGKLSPERMTFDQALDAAEKLVGNEMVSHKMRPRRDLLDKYVARLLKMNDFK